MRFTFVNWAAWGYGVRWCGRWIGRLIVMIYPLGFKRRKMIEMAQNKELGSFNSTDEVFILVSELLWPK